MIYHNTNYNVFYYPIYRCGSSVLREISEKFNYLKAYQDDEGFKLIDLNRNSPIYIIYRDPKTRLKSGLQITIKRLLNNILVQRIEEMLDNGYDILFERSLSILDNVLSSDIPYISGSWDGKILRPYHLYDVHIDHMLWRPIILKAYGYNVEMIPINEYNDNLAPFHPTAYREILNSHYRPNTFDTNNTDSTRLWDIYKKVFIDNLYYDNKNCNTIITFESWINEEIKIFDMIEKYRLTTHFKSACEDIIKKLFDDKIYFSNMYSPSVRGINRLLNIIHKYQKPIDSLLDFHKNDDMIATNTYKFINGQFIDYSKT